jgi:hypothetical protein
MKTAIILFTGDRIEYINYTINSCLEFIKKTKIVTEIDIYLISFIDYELDSNIINLKFNKPTEDEIKKFPITKQLNSYNEKDVFRINYGHYILFKSVPNIIHQNLNTFEKYDYLLKCRSDLVFETPEFVFDEKNIYTFECFWGGCRYNPLYTNDHFIFGKSEEVLKVISYQDNPINFYSFWNPEQYMNFLFEKSNFDKIELTTDKYYLLSKDRESRKFIGYPMESLNSNDINYFNKIGLDWQKIKFTNKYDY